MMDKKIVISSLAFILSACGGGSSDGSSGGPVQQTGVFIDSEVINVGYRTATLNGVTDNLGQYQYIEGEKVTFFIGELEFPEVTATPVVTPLVMANTKNIDDPTVVNIIRLLQTLDKDGNPSNGITITEEAADVAEAVNFEVSVAEFEISPAATYLIANAGQDVTVVEFVDTQVAISHFEETLAETPLSANGAIDIPFKEITIDGNNSDWSGIQPIAFDDSGDQNSTKNIIKLSIARNDTSFFILMESTGDFTFPHTRAATYSHYDAFVRFNDSSNCADSALENGYISVGNFTASEGDYFHRLHGFFDNSADLPNMNGHVTSTFSKGKVLETSFPLSMFPRNKGNYFTLNAIVSSAVESSAETGFDYTDYDKLTAGVCFNLPSL
ncbi:MAG: hypothetical protein JKY50_14400 [Oleispira sp.]|nr:hypothetical protein [Oleispira sp.]